MSNLKFHQWGRIVDTMRLWAERDNTEIVGVADINENDQIWRLKKEPILAILEALCTLIQEEDKNGFYCLYWALKTYGTVCMDFKDFDQAHSVFRRLKHQCQEKQMLYHKMINYKQMGYLFRLMKQHKKAANCFKKFLQLAWYNDDVEAEYQAYENLAIDNFYLGLMQKATFYDNKFKYGESEDADSIVRKVAVGIIKKGLNVGAEKQTFVNGKLVKTSFDKMPSPSSFGGGIDINATFGK